MTTKEAKEAVNTADMVSKNKQGQFVARWGYFYRMGSTAEKKVEYVLKQIPNAVIIDSGDHWTPFRGGASLAKSSHFYVTFTVPETKETI